jgi:hypothetical protein
LNYMITKDKRFCGATRNSLENTIRKSTLISKTNEKGRQKYFNDIRERIN